MTVEFALGDKGDRSRGLLGLGIPLLGGEPREPIAGAVEPARGEDGFSIWRGAGCAVGIASTGCAGGVEEAAGRVYAGLLRVSRGLNLYRIWNLVPDINGRSPGGVENYRGFCRARSLAFESALGKDFKRCLPAASAVGTAADELTVVFLAGSRPSVNFENPAQVPAYDYPPEHGPRPPSFARATVTEGDDGVDAFVSGTSAVVGHRTVAPNDTLGQLDRTLENLRLISRACGLGDRFGSGDRCRRHFKVFLRNPRDLARVSLEMGGTVLAPGDRVSYLGADICRSALNVEIEVAVRGAQRA
jgi:hypothetical protein